MMILFSFLLIQSWEDLYIYIYSLKMYRARSSPPDVSCFIWAVYKSLPLEAVYFDDRVFFVEIYTL